jgi:hypothetical protein
MILFKKQLFDLEVKGQRPTKVIMLRDTPAYGHAPTYQMSLTYLERQKCYGPDKKILFKKLLFDLQVKGQGPIKVITVRDTPPYGHALTYKILTYSTLQVYQRSYSQVRHIPPKMSDKFESQHSLSPTIWLDILVLVGRESGY